MGLPQYRTDVLVLGGELAGLAAAALLARRGLRVIVLGQDELETPIEIGPAAAPSVPFMVADFEAPSALRSVIEELGLRQDVRRLMPFVVPPLQLIDREHRLDLHEDEELRLLELQREFGPEGEALDRLLRTGVERIGAAATWLEGVPSLGEDGYFARRRLNKYLATPSELDHDRNQLWDDLDPAHPLGRWLRALVPFTTHVDLESISPLLAERAAARLVAGTRAAPVGERQLLAQFVRTFSASHGGEVLPAARVTKVTLTRSEVSVEVEGERTERVAPFLLDASRGPWLQELFASARSQRAYIEDRAQVPRGRVAETRSFLFKPDALPEGLATKVVLTPEDDPPVLIDVDRTPRPASGEKSILENHVVVSATTIADAPGLEETQKSLRRVIQELMPFSEPHILQEESGAARARYLYRPRDDGHFAALGPARPVATAHSRVLRVGSDVLPAWGLEGEFRSAQKAADQIAAKLGKKPRPDSSVRPRS